MNMNIFQSVCDWVLCRSQSLGAVCCVVSWWKEVGIWLQEWWCR